MKLWHEFWPLVFSIAFLVGIIGNLMASLIWGLPAVLHLHRQAERHHGEKMAQADQHHRRILTALGVDPDDDSSSAAGPGSASSASR